jgi:hypothetical protein
MTDLTLLKKATQVVQTHVQERLLPQRMQKRQQQQGMSLNSCHHRRMMLQQQPRPLAGQQ